MPLIERVVTVTGKAIKNPANLRVKLGVLFSALIEECETEGEIGKVIMGGPMMGLAQFTTEVPVVKATSGLVVYTKEEIKTFESSPCIKCSKCVDVCPMYLLPTLLAEASRNQRYELCREYNVTDCMECGLCSYVCPSKIELTHWIKVGKAEVNKK